MLKRFFIILALVIPLNIDVAFAQRIIAVVNDRPISEYDMEQRVRLNKMFGVAKGSRLQQKKLALKNLIEDILKIQEAKRIGFVMSKTMIQQYYNEMANNGGGVQSLKSELRKMGIKEDTVKKQIVANTSWGQVLRSKFGNRIKIREQQVDKKFATIKKKPIKTTVLYVLQQLVLPVSANADQFILQSRFIESQKIMKSFKGCGSFHRITKGIFNVRIMPKATVPSSNLPKKLKQILDKAGTGRIIGPSRSPNGIELLGFCGKKVIKPEPVSRDKVKSMLLNQQYGVVGKRLLKDLLRDAIVDYKDSSLK